MQWIPSMEGVKCHALEAIEKGLKATMIVESSIVISKESTIYPGPGHRRALRSERSWS